MRQILGPTLVGREEEIDVLRMALARARDREGALVLVTGEAGIGKTRLARETADDGTRAGLPTLATLDSLPHLIQNMDRPS